MDINHPNKNKIIVVVGPTSSGKSDLAVHLAKKFNGEVVSADSRQVYKGLDIGTGKITKKEMDGIPHHLLDVANPKNSYTAQNFKKDGAKAIKEILSRGKVPIIAGGTGFYIQILTENITLPEVPPNKELRDKLKNKSTGELFSILIKLDPNRAENIDPKNSHRLMRAIEIATSIGKVPKQKSQPLYKALYVGIKTDTKELKEKIHKRLIQRIKVGMISEVKNLHNKGLSWKRMEELGMEYKYLAKYLKKEISKEDMLEKIETENCKYAKRQKTWFKRNKKIKWFTLKDIKKVENDVNKFLNKK